MHMRTFVQPFGVEVAACTDSWSKSDSRDVNEIVLLAQCRSMTHVLDGMCDVMVRV
jgi:hypothetical protein